MLKYWSRMLRDDEHVVGFLREAVPPESVAHLDLHPNLELRVVGPRLTGFLWQEVTLPLHARGLDVLFCPAYTAPFITPPGVPLVVATHSVNEAAAGAHAWWYSYTYTPYHRLSALKGESVIVPCASVRDLVMRDYGVASERIEIVPQGADPSFKPMDDEALLAETRRKLFGADVPYVLFVTKLSVRRNIPNLIAGFARWKRTGNFPHKLLLVGPNHENLPLAEICAEHGVSDSVVQTDGRFAHHTDLVPIFNAADVFIHPSKYEGWSMVTVEALACGTASIIANRGGLKDTVDGHAYMLDDLEPEGIAKALGDVIGNPALRAELKLKARARGAALTWEDTTRRTLEVVRRVAARGRAARTELGEREIAR